MEDGQLEGVDLVAAVGVGVCVSIYAALRVGGAVPGVTVTNGIFRYGGHRVVDGQMQGDDTVASSGGTAKHDECGRIGALGVGLAVPGEALTCHGGFNALCGNAVAHDDGDGGGLAATTIGAAGYIVGGGSCR